MPRAKPAYRVMTNDARCPCIVDTRHHGAITHFEFRQRHLAEQVCALMNEAYNAGRMRGLRDVEEAIRKQYLTVDAEDDKPGVSTLEICAIVPRECLP